MHALAATEAAEDYKVEAPLINYPFISCIIWCHRFAASLPPYGIWCHFLLAQGALPFLRVAINEPAQGYLLLEIYDNSVS